MKILLFAFLPMIIFAAEVDISQSDIVDRTINFAIFVAILWYLLANRIKLALQARKDGISAQLNSVQEKLAASKAQKAESLRKLEDSKRQASDIINNAQREIAIIKQNLDKQHKNDLEILKHNHQELLNFEQKRMKKLVINEILEELLSTNDIKLSKSDYIDILLKRAS